MRPVVLAALAIAATACANAESRQAPARATPTTAQILESMAALAGKPADRAGLAAWAQKVDGDAAALGAYIDELLANPRFAGEIVPTLVFGSFVNVRNYYAVPSAFVLKSAPHGALYLRAPCAASEAVVVRPWWDLRAQVRVCPEAYRPAKWTLEAGEHSYRSSSVLACDSQIGSPEAETHPLCGCGPNLIRCLRDGDHYNALNRSLMDEVKRTTAYVVERDLPMARLFTTNETFRDRDVELYYRRQRIGAMQIADVERELAGIAAWPEGGTWAPRPEVRPGQHAGVLTSPQVLHWLPDRRQRQRGYYEILWCNLKNTFGATTEKVFEINASGNNFFAHDSWKQLAHTELCTDCHARLDYGFQFFLGYPDSRASTHFIPSLQPEATGPLYGADIRDARGTAALAPLEFAKLATAQPEFVGCMTNQLVTYVLGDAATGDDMQAVAAAIAQAGTFKAAMKVALERYVARQRGPGPEPIASRPTATTIGPELRAQLDDHCVDCHGADGELDLTRSELPPDVVTRMTDKVAFGVMPKEQTLEARTRDRLVELLIALGSHEPASRDEARRYYLGKQRGLPAHQIDNVFNMVERKAGAPSGISWGALERGIWSEQATLTPGFVATSALEALRACSRRTGGGSLEQCLLETTSPRTLSRHWSPSP